MKFFGVPVKSFNLEITNRCTLACPECFRTNNPWIKQNLTDLPLSVLENVFPLADRDQFKGLRINLCGAYGDCIYHREFHNVIRYLKTAGLTLCVETNGSHRKPGWWEKTCEILDQNDVINFSVDGLEDTNHIYRINARWQDIITAMKLCASKVPVTWKFILFSHNEHQVEEAKALAKEIGVRDLTFKKSGRFRQEDPLAPRNDDYIGVVTRNRRIIQGLIDSNISTNDFDRQVSIKQKCLFGKDLAITAFGHLYPCTSCESSDTTSWFYKNREHFDLRTHSIREIFASPKWRELERLWARASTAPKSCLYYCGVHHDFNGQYADESRSDRPNKPEDAVTLSFGC